MAVATTSAFDPRPADVRRLNRMIAWSIGIHALVAAIVLFTPRSWWVKEPEPRRVMTISLGGSPGPSSTGRTSIGGRTVEQEAPPPPRPETTRPTPPAPPAPTSAAQTRQPPRQQTPPRTAATAPARQTPPQSTAKPQPTAPQTASRAPVTGPQVSQGSTRADTGARGQGVGLSFGGGLSGGETDLSDFCCPEWVSAMLGAVEARWNKNQPERGTTVIRFTIARDGTIDRNSIEVLQRSGYGVLDRAAQAALLDARLPPLPAAYPNPTLTVRLSFPYGTL